MRHPFLCKADIHNPPSLPVHEHSRFHSEDINTYL